MKTKIIITLILITLNIHLVSARGYSTKGTEGPSKSESSVSLITIAPVTPSEATFEESPEVNADLSAVISLAPVAPAEASFEDLTSGEMNPSALTPSNQQEKSTEKGKTVHPAFPLPCDAKYGCSL